jgi:hypothetical protein
MAHPEDEFAQTRGADDLFDDEIIPVSAEQQTEVIAPEPEPELKEVPVETPTEKPIPRGDTPQRGRGERGRGRRGRGKGRGGRESDSKRSESSSRKKHNANANANANASDARETPKPETPDESTEQVLDEHNDDEAVNGEAQRVPAVRGDRSATGGLRKVCEPVPRE